MQLLTALFFIFFLSPATLVAWGQSLPLSQQVMTFAGETAVPEDCPIRLLEARFNAIEHPDKLNRWEILQLEVKVQNLSAQPISRATMGFEFQNAHGGMLRLIQTAGLIPVGATYHLIAKKISLKASDLSFYGSLTVRSLAIGFEDGSHWLVPRQFDGCMLTTTLSQRAPITLRVNYDLDLAYQATLTLQKEKIVAYRLGVVKDTDEEYGFRLGDWVELPPDLYRSGRVMTISGKDVITSLRQEQIFTKAERLRSFPNGKTARDRGGVALFIAEVKFADGTFWRQDLRRPELLWGAY